jgi:hypothetical protein
MSKSDNYKKYISNPENKARVKARMKEWRAKNAEKIKEDKKRYRTDPEAKEKERIARKQWATNNPDKLSAMNKRHSDKRSGTPEKIEYDRNYRCNPENKKKRNEYLAKRFKEDPQYREAHNIRARLNCFVKGTLNSKSIIEQIGCTKDCLINHIASRFTEGMSWDNWGKWHIDHIKPLTSFDLLNPADKALAAHYTNLQPLWAIENIKKRNK